MTAGSGHRRAAEAIAEAVRQRLPETEVSCVDVLSYSPRWLRVAYPLIYRRLVTHLTWVWGLLYHLLDQPWMYGLYQPLRRAWNCLMARRFLHWVRSLQPDAVITTHFFPTDVMAAAKRAGWLSARLIVVVTDLFPHRMWLVEEADLVVVASDETKAICQRRGIAAGRLRALGIPISQQFRLSCDRAAILQRCGLDGARRTLLVTSGGMGVGPIQQFVERLRVLEASRPHHLQLLVVCGENDRLRQRLQRLGETASLPVCALGFTDAMHELMQASDLLITKPGGLTVMEALAVGLPMVFCGTIPGQEQGNEDYVVRHGAGLKADQPDRCAATVRQLLEHPVQLQAMRSRALALSRPDAALQLVETCLMTDAPAAR